MDANPQPTGTPSSEANDRLIAALCYPITIILSLVVLLTDMKNKPLLKYHAVQSLVVDIVLVILISVTAPFTCGITSLLWFITLYWAYQVYQGKEVVIPVVTDFIKQQGWA